MRVLLASVGSVAAMFDCSTRTVRTMVADGELPGPINPEISLRRHRWSVAELERFADPAVPEIPVVEQDLTPPHGIVRPHLSVVGE